MILTILPEVADDITDGAKWYRRRRRDLGIEFASAVYAFIDEIVSSPLRRRPVYKDFRRGLMRRFPYAVYYRVRDNELIISLVFHTARDPKITRRLLRVRGKKS